MKKFLKITALLVAFIVFTNTNAQSQTTTTIYYTNYNQAAGYVLYLVGGGAYYQFNIPAQNNYQPVALGNIISGDYQVYFVNTISSPCNTFYLSALSGRPQYIQNACGYASFPYTMIDASCNQFSIF